MKRNIGKIIIGSISCGLLALGLAACNSAASSVEYKTYYVAANGTTDGDGSAEKPLSFLAAIGMANPGDTILLAGGTYTSDTRISVTRSGRPNEDITIKPQSEEDRVVFDFSSMIFASDSRGIQIYGNYWHFLDIEVCGAGDNGMYVAGSYNTIENCQFYNNRDTGLQLGRAYSSDTTIESWPSYNLIKNCTSFANYDAETLGENADGFAAKLTIGYGNVFDGCMAFRNSDDGWDLFAKEDSGNIGTVILYNCVSFENGFLPYAIDRTTADGVSYKSYNTQNGDGIGFKLGGSTMEGDVILENCLAFNNKLHGFSDNSNPGVISIKNCSSFNNCIGLNDDGTVAARGIKDTDNKSNNFDLARDINSYNNYYGLLSYVNNQGSFVANGESSYNSDAYRGSVAYSIFNTSYDRGEVYTAYGDYKDASVYATESTDSSFANGVEYTGTLNDECFADISCLNALCDSVDKLPELSRYHNELRNEDNSINMGDHWKITSQSLLTYANGSSIGHDLSKASDDEYNHYLLNDFEGCVTRDDIKVASAYNVLEVIANDDAIYQSFEISKRIHGCEIEWTSSNPNVIVINNTEKISVSNSVYITGEVITPAVETTVKLTAVITCGDATKTKEFDVVVKSRNQSLGILENKGSSTIKLNQYETYHAPTIYAIDSSSNTSSALSKDLYSLSYKYEFAPDRNSRFYEVDNVYTAVSGVFKVTVKATSLIASDNGKATSLVYYVYILDKNCDIDFIGGVSSFTLNNEGFTISAELSNILGKVYAVSSTTELSLTPEALINHTDVQEYEISSDSISAEFLADNNNLNGYYVYYLVSNINKTKTSTIYQTHVTVQNVTTTGQFYEIATSAKLNGESGGNTTIYSLANDLDFTGYEWKIVSGATFSGLFNGNGKTISNITINASGAKNVNIFFKVQGGTVMNTIFKNISITNTNVEGKQVGIIGELQGGYVADIIAINVTAIGYQGVGGIIAAVTGGKNYISTCVLDNRSYENAVITARNGKYAGGIIGNVQKNGDQASLEMYVKECAAYATIGDGTDVGGNNGGIIGRVKNESSVYTTSIINCVFVGTVIGKGQYNAGIVGDFDNGAGTVIIKYCCSDSIFVYGDDVLDVRLVNVDDSETQRYAHKNSNPIVGRAVSGSGVYDTIGNFGTWTEYYSKIISSTSWCFSYGVDYVLTDKDYANVMAFDLENTWTNVNGTLFLKSFLAKTANA